jgi:outer membrane receptor protein involved in Fe transport
MTKHLLLALLMAAAALPALAQDKPRPPAREFKPETRQASDVLPALQLPEYVITGSDMISFTEDRKTALAWPDRNPFSARAGRGVREQRFFGTAPTRMPLRKAALTGSTEVLRIKAGAGTWSTPHLQAWFADRYSLGDLATHAMYERSEGHVPRANYSRFAFDLDGGTYLPRDVTPLLASSRLQGSFHANVHNYGLYADKLERASPPLDFRRELLSLDWQADLISRRNRVLDHSLTVFFRHTSAEEQLALLDTMDLDTYRGSENRMGIDGSARMEIGGLDFNIDAGLHVNDLSETAEGSTRPFFTNAGARTRYHLGENTGVDLGARLYLYRGSDHATQFRIYPTVLMRHRLGESWTLHGGYAPVVRERSFAEFLRRNPYTMLASAIRHTDVPLRFEAGASFDDRSRTSARVAASYSASQSWARFSLLPDPVRQQWELRYDGSSTVLDLRGDLAHMFSDDTRIQGSVVFRTAQNDVVDGDIPYLPTYEARVLLQHDFPFGLRLQSSVLLAGEQHNADGQPLPGWLLLGLELEYRIIDPVALYLRFDNILDQKYERWDDYRERPFFMMGGVVVRL